jgi:hypothetical protein
VSIRPTRDCLFVGKRIKIHFAVSNLEKQATTLTVAFPLIVHSRSSVGQSQSSKPPLKTQLHRSWPFEAALVRLEA